MAETSVYLITPAHFHRIRFDLPATNKISITCVTPLKIQSLSQKHNQPSQVRRRGPSRNQGRLVTISPSEGRWEGKWSTQHLLSLRDLQLQDLVQDQHTRPGDAIVSVTLSVQRHASFGLSVDGRILTSFMRRCSNCSSPYCRQIDTNFTVWVLSSSRGARETGLPEIGGDDPSLSPLDLVIYVKPGYEASLDSLIQDTIRLNSSVKDTCSESCERAEPTIQYIGRRSSASVDKRWYRLLELKKPQNRS